MDSTSVNLHGYWL